MLMLLCVDVRQVHAGQVVAGQMRTGRMKQKKVAGCKPATFGCTVFLFASYQTTASTFRPQARPKKKKLKKLK